MNALLLASAFAFAAALSPRPQTEVPPPHPHGPVPSPRQLRWHERELYGFLHFTTNTFTDREWGYGDEDPVVFAPTDFDADQIAGVAVEAGMAGLILTGKHHDGFCLWPSALTDHDVAASPWREGKGDVVREIAEACRRRGLAFGVYLSPWDRHHADYGRPAYVDYFRAQLRELLTGYGPIFEVWFDGANGGDGYYGGARETRRIDPSTYYGWDETIALVRALQPDACIFSDFGPDVRWVGNEDGIAGDPCWAAYTPLPRDGETVAAPGTTRTWEGTSGHRDGERWIPAEADVSIRPGWFYHAAEDEAVKSPAQLVDLYYASVGRGASLLLNLPPDRRGQIHANDVAALRGFRAILAATFAADLARGARASASAVRGDHPAYGPENVLDGDLDTYWATDDGVAQASLVLELPAGREWNVLSLREHLPLGQRVDQWAVDVWRDGAWAEIAHGTAIGARRLWRGEHQSAPKIRLRIVQAAACPAIAELSVHAEPRRP
ncbi:MAG: alpha-L-fucosidase [Planctomycetota bacterium]